jgi:hypothetical protein
MRVKTNSPSPAQRQVNGGAQKAISYQFNFGLAASAWHGVRSTPDRVNLASIYESHWDKLGGREHTPARGCTGCGALASGDISGAPNLSS